MAPLRLATLEVLPGSCKTWFRWFCFTYQLDVVSCDVHSVESAEQLRQQWIKLLLQGVHHLHTAPAEPGI